MVGTYSNSKIQQALSDSIQLTPEDLFVVPLGLIIRARAKKFKEAFNWIFQNTWNMMDYKGETTEEEQTLKNLIHIQNGLEDHGFRSYE
jgi:hypothetical protein